MNGNTFADSRSAKSDHFQMGFVAGFAYSIHHLSTTLAMVDLGVFEKESTRDNLFGSFTVAWRF